MCSEEKQKNYLKKITESITQFFSLKALAYFCDRDAHFGLKFTVVYKGQTDFKLQIYDPVCQIIFQSIKSILFRKDKFQFTKTDFELQKIYFTLQKHVSYHKKHNLNYYNTIQFIKAQIKLQKHNSR